MTRKLLLVAAAFTMLFVVSNASTPAADAQITCTSFGPAPDYYATVVLGPCPGSSTVSPSTAANTSGGGGSSSGAAAAAASTGAANTGTAGSAGTTTTSLAVTGAESGVFGYIGAGLVGLGALALGTARRRQSDLG